MAVMDRPAPFGRRDAFAPSRQRPFQASTFGRSANFGGADADAEPTGQPSPIPDERLDDTTATLPF